jgi:hypothetical protein
MPANKVLAPFPVSEDSETKRLEATVKAVFDTENMALKSNLTKHQIRQILRAQIFAIHFKSKLMQHVVDYALQFGVSDKGGGRKDLRTVLQAVMRQRDQQLDTRLQDKLL